MRQDFIQNWINTDSSKEGIDNLFLLINFLVEGMEINVKGVENKISDKIFQIIS